MIMWACMYIKIQYKKLLKSGYPLWELNKHRNEVRRRLFQNSCCLTLGNVFNIKKLNRKLYLKMEAEQIELKDEGTFPFINTKTERQLEILKWK